MRAHHGRRRRLGTAPDGLFTTLLRANCSVAIASRSAKRLIDPRKKCYACDVCDEEDVRRVCDSIPDLVGVIHCAGVTYGGPFTTNEDDSKLLISTSSTLGHALRRLKRRRTVHLQILLARVVHFRGRWRLCGNLAFYDR